MKKVLFAVSGYLFWIGCVAAGIGCGLGVLALLVQIHSLPLFLFALGVFVALCALAVGYFTEEKK